MSVMCLNASGQPASIIATQLDWSEVWRYLRVSWVARQLYMRSGVTGTTNYSTIMNQFRTTYLSSTANMDSLAADQLHRRAQLPESKSMALLSATPCR